MNSANKEEAKRCLYLARAALATGDRAKAKRLAEKSLRLCRGSEAEAFLRQLSEPEGGGSASSAEGGAAGSEGVRGEGVRQRRSREADVDESSDYTPQQQEAVDKVLGCRDYYQILGVSRDAEEADLKKQYRRLALQLHPDKNRAPRADEAFKAVSSAYTVLSDPDKRQQYDRYGEEGLRPSNYGRGFEPDVSPDDLFRMFFGDGFSMNGDAFFYSSGPSSPYYVYRPSRHRHAHQGHHHIHRQQAGSAWMQVCQVMPIVVLVLVSLFSNVLFSSVLPPSPFALHKTTEYNVKRVTEKHKMPYYVTESFSREYPKAEGVRAVEREVEESWRWELQGQCQQERYRANRKGKGKAEPASCKKLRQLLSAG